MNYERSLSPGKAYFYYLENGVMQPIVVDRTRIRAPKSGYAEGFANNNFKVKNLAPQDLAYWGRQYIEVCYAPPCVNEIYCEFSLRINANSLEPKICSLEDTRKTLVELAECYRDFGGYREIANRISKNILMGTWVWRNRTCRSLSVEVKTSDSQSIVVDNAFRLTWYGEWASGAKDSLDKLTTYMEQALFDPTDLYHLDVTATLNIGSGDEVYPSQEYLEEKQDGMPSKQLAQVRLKGHDEKTVAFHAQKVGAALQTIDDWWHEDADKPLRTNEYGADREYVIARRHPEFGNDFYQLVKRSEHWLEQMKSSGKIPDEVHFIMAVLVKASLFSNLSEKKR